MPLWPGTHLFENLETAWERGNFDRVMLNSFIVAFGVTAGKILLASLSAFSIVYFNYRIRMLVFLGHLRHAHAAARGANRADLRGRGGCPAAIPQHSELFGLEVGLPEWNLLNSYQGLILPSSLPPLAPFSTASSS